MSISLSPQEWKHYYRQFIRIGKKAIVNKAPQKYVYSNFLHRRFALKPQNKQASQSSLEGPNSSDETRYRLENTLSFLENAAQYNGMENRILQNILFIEYGRSGSRPLRSRMARSNRKGAHSTALNTYDTYDEVVANLNESMRLLL